MFCVVITKIIISFLYKSKYNLRKLYRIEFILFIRNALSQCYENKKKTSSNKEKENEQGLVNIMMHLDLVQL